MTSRVLYRSVASGGVTALVGIEQYVAEGPLEEQILELVRLRASQINGCARCLAMHAAALRALGEDETRIDVLAAWRETSLFTPAERAALAWTEAVTKLSDPQIPDALYEDALTHFGEKGLADLTLAIAAINAWNRLNIAFHAPLPSGP